MDWRGVWRGLFPRRMLRPDVSDEISFHIEERIRELVTQGWGEYEARKHVLARFGNVDDVEQACLEYDGQRMAANRGRMMMERWVQDLRLAGRALRRAPGFTAVVVLTLALGIGASTAVFSVVESVLLRPLPFRDADELAVVWQNDRATGTVREPASPADFDAYRERSRSFTELGAYYVGTGVFSRPDGPAHLLSMAYVSENIDDVLGVGVQRGRGILAEEDRPGGANVVVLTDGFWRNEFGADADVVGRIVTVDGSPFEVVGVLEPDLRFPEPDIDVWLPVRIDPANQNYNSHWAMVLGRMAPGRRVEDAQAEMASIMADLEVERPGNVNRGAFVEPLAEVGRGDVRAPLWILFSSVLAVLLVACVNVANLLLARGSARRREIAVLRAVGATGSQLLRRFLAEGLIVALVSGLGGLLVARLGLGVLTTFVPPEIARLGDPALNGSVLGFALTLALMVGLGFSVLPAVQNRRGDLQLELRDGRGSVGSTRLPVRRFLVATQLAAAVVLLITASLLISSVRNLQSVDLGFEAENVLRAHFTVPQARYPRSFDTYPHWPEVIALNRRIVEAAEGLPGVRSAAIGFSHPLERGFTNSFRVEGREYDPAQGEISTRMVTPEYVDAAGLRVVEGRFLSPSDDTESELVVVLNREAVERYFPGGGALGRRIAFWGPTYRTVVGVVDNERIHGLAADPPPAMYVSLLQNPQRGGELSLILRTEVPPLTLVSALREAIVGVDPEIPVYGAATMTETIREAVGRERFITSVLTFFASLAVFLAVLGVHGVLSYLVAQRSHEVGVRMALGATRGDVVRQIVRQGAGMALLGVALGVGGAVAASGILEGMLFGVSATSPWVYLSVAVGLGALAAAASALPARRAASVDPVISLRGD